MHAREYSETILPTVGLYVSHSGPGSEAGILAPSVPNWLPWLPLGASLVSLAISGPRFFVDEVQIVLEVLLLTVVTRTIGLRAGLLALAWSTGVVAPLTVVIGMVLAAAGIDMTDSVGNTVIVPVIEESLKLLPVLLVAWMIGRWQLSLLNLSDFLLLGVMAGAGFGMVESSYFDGVHTGERYAPHVLGLNLVPTAWGEAGYVGHGAATGLIALAYGFGAYLRRTRSAAAWWWAVPAAASAWVLVEHGFANAYINTSSSGLLVLGGGRVTPWLFLAAAFVAIGIDARHAMATLKRSPTIQARRALITVYLDKQRRSRRWPTPAAVLTILAQFRWLNATAWFDATGGAASRGQAVAK